MNSFMSMPDGGFHLRPERVKIATMIDIWRYANPEKWAESKALGDLEKNCLKHSVVHGNLLLDQGAEVFIDRVFGFATPDLYNNANARILVSDNTSTENAADTGIGGASSATAAMEATYPQKSGEDTVILRAVFGASVGNFAWESFGVDNGATGALLLNRKRSSQGTKASPNVWTVEISFVLAGA